MHIFTCALIIQCTSIFMCRHFYISVLTCVQHSSNCCRCLYVHHRL